MTWKDEIMGDWSPTLKACNPASVLLAELLDNRLSVCVVGCLRVVQSRNAQWYRELCAGYTRWRRNRNRTIIIKRYLVVRTLRAILAGECNPASVYYQRIVPYLERVEHDREGIAS